jgi:hypothetical protein
MFRAVLCVCPTLEILQPRWPAFSPPNMTPRAAIWFGMAQQARVAAARLRDPELRRQLLIVAGCYEAMGKRADALAGTQEAANENSAAVGRANSPQFLAAINRDRRLQPEEPDAAIEAPSCGRVPVQGLRFGARA